MVLGILNKTVPHLWQYPIYWWTEVIFSSTRITFDSVYKCEIWLVWWQTGWWTKWSWFDVDIYYIFDGEPSFLSNRIIWQNLSEDGLPSAHDMWCHCRSPQLHSCYVMRCNWYYCDVIRDKCPTRVTMIMTIILGPPVYKFLSTNFWLWNKRIMLHIPWWGFGAGDFCNVESVSQKDTGRYFSLYHNQWFLLLYHNVIFSKDRCLLGK